MDEHNSHNPQCRPTLRHLLLARRWAEPVAVFAISLTIFGYKLSTEPHFVDESAYISQSFFADLFVSGDCDNPAWVSYGGYDLPPLPKYLIGTSLRAGGFRRPGPAAMWAWYANTSRQFVTSEGLTAARWPSVLLGACGCVAIYMLGTLGLDRRAGLLAAIFLMANPLYQMHARRAMSDVPAEALILATIAVGLWSWQRLLSERGADGPALALAIGAGVLCGLATLSKLNGVLGGFVLMAWAAMAMRLGIFPLRGRSAVVLGAFLAGCFAFATFAVLNPFLYAHPKGTINPGLASVARLTFIERVGLVAHHRASVSVQAKATFPDDALNSATEKIKSVAVQGFGRFGPFGPRGRTDSTVRYDGRQDWTAMIWFPWVALGLVAAIRRGRAQVRAGEPPTAWAVAVQAAVAGLVVTAFIPLAWDRYYLSIQPGSALLGSFAAVEGFDRARRRLIGKLRTGWTP